MTAPKLTPDMAREIATWQEYRVKNGLGQTFRTTATRVVIRKPRWMPWRMFTWLMRTVVIEEREAPAAAAPRKERREHQRRSRSR